ncbi:universal stress protein (plasmid) [Arthrobacter sp. Z1-9]
MTEIIVVGVDGSETAKRASASAAALATTLGAKLHVVSAFNTDRAQVLGLANDEIAFSEEKHAEKVARETAAALASKQLQVEYFAIRATPAQALIQQAEKHNALMIVVGSKRMSGIGRVLGSVADSVAHNAPCHVYIAKTDSA